MYTGNVLLIRLEILWSVVKFDSIERDMLTVTFKYWYHIFWDIYR